ncbi:DUF2812 domain-containing protein [Cytobacillus purgationiresistens]|uniref:DUF2812 domain-containing protein n=1 Tax=Cytobacillus purgationiresistens TaxID=863449 RepID=A0ABU0AH62_9BACI|nr:DUF2812 domain-containing protein [Cytobacillus purgationiresistens]MDQ0270598.1 hypothetical protein [Cytobacillus purgationiresistens]
MRKFKLFIDVKKEEKWLNEMLQAGWTCKQARLFGSYTFEKASEQEQVIRIDYQNFGKKLTYSDYLQLYRDYGWDHISGSKWSGTQYWIKKMDGRDELFSDEMSAKALYKRLMGNNGFFILFVIFVFLSHLNAGSGIFDYAWSLKSAYLTPGLWEKEGIAFVSALLFETPFALMRFGSPWLIILSGVFCAFAYLKYRKYTAQLTAK